MTDAVFLIIYFIFFSVLFSKIPSIVGWERDEFILLVGTFHMVNSLFLSIFYPNLVMLPEHIKGGTLDHFLLKPMEAQLLISIHTIDIGSLFNILLGLSLVISSALNLSLSFTLGQILGFFLTILSGISILYNLFFIIVASSFWLQDASWCASLYLTLNNYMDKPMEIYPGVIRRVLIYFVPMALVANIPSGILLNRDVKYFILIELLIMGILFCLSRKIWNTGINKYESASS